MPKTFPVFVPPNIPHFLFPKEFPVFMVRVPMHKIFPVFVPPKYSVFSIPGKIPRLPFLSTITRLQRSEHKCASQHNALYNVLLPPLLPSCILIGSFSHLMTHAKERCLNSPLQCRRPLKKLWTEQKMLKRFDIFQTWNTSCLRLANNRKPEPRERAGVQLGSNISSHFTSNFSPAASILWSQKSECIHDPNLWSQTGITDFHLRNSFCDPRLGSCIRALSHGSLIILSNYHGNGH